ncbi:hypothetical protein K6L05_00860 [Salinicoccus roseus]|uniref:hypothetical protein n=1 Tax=Salinicoccus roseus TaxID=45670 RepID=UPI001CA65764|nr:hypothetical protein [Salinicoccus roseus]MBY8908334.1 hypothetical protein [Salinicoccus roseus]
MKVQLQEKLEDIIRQPYMFELILDEDPEQNVYEEFDVNVVKSTLGKLNWKLVTVISLQIIDDVYYGLFKHGGEIIGWTAVRNSHYVHPKRMEPAKVDIEKFNAHELNSKVMGSMDMIIELRGRLFSSKSYIEVGDERLELLFLKGNLRGLVKTEHLQKGVFVKHSTMIKADAPRYRDSNFSVQLPPKEEDFEARVIQVFPGLNIAKLKHGKSEFWMRTQEMEKDLKETGLVIPPLTEDAHQHYIGERQKTKAIIDALLRRQIQLEKEADNAKKRLKRIETLYNNLKSSKLGKIQVKVWERRKRRGK